MKNYNENNRNFWMDEVAQHLIRQVFDGEYLDTLRDSDHVPMAAEEVMENLKKGALHGTNRLLDSISCEIGEQDYRLWLAEMLPNSEEEIIANILTDGNRARYVYVYWNLVDRGYHGYIDDQDEETKQPWEEYISELYLYAEEEAEIAEAVNKVDEAARQAWIEKVNSQLTIEDMSTEWLKSPSLFRGKDISWVVGKTGKDDTHGIRYDGKSYTRQEFFKAMFEDYKKEEYRMKFNTDDIYRLTISRRTRLRC